jgi:hypothetical protein
MFPPAKFVQQLLEINTQSMDELRRALFGGVPTVRINNKYPEPEMATDMLEVDMEKTLEVMEPRSGFRARKG